MLFYKDIFYAKEKVNWVMYINYCCQLSLQTKGMYIKDTNLRLGLLLHDKEVEQMSKVVLRPSFSTVVEIFILPPM